MGTGLMSPSHIALVLLVALLVLGPKRLPEVGRSLGNGLRGFRDAIGGDDHEGGIGGSIRDAFSDEPRKPEAVTASPSAPVPLASSSPSADRYPLVGQDPHLVAAHGEPSITPTAAHTSAPAQTQQVAAPFASPSEASSPGGAPPSETSPPFPPTT